MTKSNFTTTFELPKIGIKVLKCSSVKLHSNLNGNLWGT